MSDASAELYQAVIDEHRRRPRNRGPLPNAQRVAKRENPACGDVCTLQLRLAAAPAAEGSPAPSPALPPDTRIAAAGFTGAGCALSQASASLATVALAECSVAEARNLAALVETLVSTGRPPSHAPDLDSLGDLAALVAAHRFPARHACALLAWRAAIDALDGRS